MFFDWIGMNRLKDKTFGFLWECSLCLHKSYKFSFSNSGEYESDIMSLKMSEKVPVKNCLHRLHWLPSALVFMFPASLQEEWERGFSRTVCLASALKPHSLSPLVHVNPFKFKSNVFPAKKRKPGTTSVKGLEGITFICISLIPTTYGCKTHHFFRGLQLNSKIQGWKDIELTGQLKWQNK